MRRWLSLAALAVLASACTTTPADPNRLVFGVSGSRPAGQTGSEADAKMHGFLDWKISQVCTLGHDTVKITTLAAEQNQQLVDEELRCKPYTLAWPF